MATTTVSRSNGFFSDRRENGGLRTHGSPFREDFADQFRQSKGGRRYAPGDEQCGLHGTHDQVGRERCLGCGFDQGSRQDHDREGESASAEAATEHFAPVLESAPEAIQRAAQPGRCLIARQSFEVAEDQRRSVSVRQEGELLVKGLEKLPQFQHTDCSLIGAGYLRWEGLHDVPSELLAEVARDPKGHPVKPTAQRFLLANRAYLLGKDEEGGLAGILGIVFVAQDASANAEHHAAMPVDESCKTCLIPCVEPREQIRIRFLLTMGGQQDAQTLQYVIEGILRHFRKPCRVASSY